MGNKIMQETTPLVECSAFHRGMSVLEASLRNTEDSETIISGLLKGAAEFYLSVSYTHLGGRGMLTLCRMFLWLIFYSFAGSVYESILCSITERKCVNRGFLYGPLCPIYGSGAILIRLALGRLTNPLVLFLSGMALCSILEYAVSWLMEKLFHARWWDYSHMRFQLNGRICLLGAVVFGAFAVALVLWIHPAVYGLSLIHIYKEGPGPRKRRCTARWGRFRRRS